MRARAHRVAFGLLCAWLLVGCEDTGERTAAADAGTGVGGSGLEPSGGEAPVKGPSLPGSRGTDITGPEPGRAGPTGVAERNVARPGSAMPPRPAPASGMGDTEGSTGYNGGEPAENVNDGPRPRPASP